MTDQVPHREEARLREALEAALRRLLSEGDRPAEVILAQAEAEFSSLLVGKDLKEPDAAQLARVMREVLADARRRLHNQDHFNA